MAKDVINIPGNPIKIQKVIPKSPDIKRIIAIIDASK